MIFPKKIGLQKGSVFQKRAVVFDPELPFSNYWYDISSLECKPGLILQYAQLFGDRLFNIYLISVFSTSMTSLPCVNLRGPVPRLYLSVRQTHDLQKYHLFIIILFQPDVPDAAVWRRCRVWLSVVTFFGFIFLYAQRVGISVSLLSYIQYFSSVYLIYI